MDGGSLRLEAATGRGVFVITEALMGDLGLPVAGARVARAERRRGT
jgi:glutamate dehydrogenase/leucine dehydrogenase